MHGTYIFQRKDRIVLFSMPDNPVEDLIKIGESLYAVTSEKPMESCWYSSKISSAYIESPENSIWEYVESEPSVPF